MAQSDSSTAPFPVLHSILDLNALRLDVLTKYDIGTSSLCAPFPPGINDSYLVRTREGGNFILRVYRANWRSVSDIYFEMDVLRHLHAARVPVSVPIVRRDGSLMQTVRAPEGDRHIALFTFAPGEPLDQDSMVHCTAHGRALAAIHTATDRLASAHSRAPLAPPALIEWSLAQMEPYFASRPDDWAYLRDVAGRLTAQAAMLDATDWGICHGDPYSGNAHITDDGAVIFFDFDCCGMGWRAYDLAGMRWYLEHTKRDTDGTRWQAFLTGYRTVRAISEADIAAVPYLVAVRTLWHNALGARAASLGIQRYDDFCQRGLVMLRDRESHAGSNAGESKDRE